ncbi:MAG: Ferredoxin hydrogenase [Firmicutes bacterium]|nr:Ferredoxin hydrogenase [Bacillota bacterium]
MNEQPKPFNIKPRILYQVAKAAWEGKLFERREEICSLVHKEFADQTTRRHVANQIRIAMGLDPHNSDSVISSHDQEALMGMSSEPIIVANPDACSRCDSNNRPCENICPVAAITHDELGQVKIDHTKCMGEGHCVAACSFGALTEKANLVPLIDLLRQRTHPVYASVAPAFAGQFGVDVTPGKLRSALLKLGFKEMVETALYADIVTIKEAFEFDHYVKNENDFLITSCCCPVWIKLIENRFPELFKHISPSVSPMIASARIIKTFEQDAKVVFIGPCIAKKSEALLPDLKGAVDFVLTFQELSTIFEATEINPAMEKDDENPQASWGGRVYGRTGGVSAAVEATLKNLVPRRAQSFIPVKLDGIPDCQKGLEQLKHGELKANFIEGMACKGGCVGGPGINIPPEEGTKHINIYSKSSASPTPVENPHVYSLLARLGSEAQVTDLTVEGPAAAILARQPLAKK